MNIAPLRQARVFFCVLSLLGAFRMADEGRSVAAQSIPVAMKYFGQKPPGRVPEVFAPGVISGAGYRLHGSIVFSPDFRVALWSVIPPDVMAKAFADGAWSEPESLGLQGRAIQAPTFSADGVRLCYQALVGGGASSLDLWCVERTEEGWGAPSSIGVAVNTDGLESQPSLTADGTLYFTGTLEGAGLDRGIYRSRPTDGEYRPPELLGGGINSEYVDYCPWIARDESYLLFASSRPRRDEHLHLHVSFRQGDGSWSEPTNIHSAIRFEGEARFPSVSPDGRFLFFISEDLAYWVDLAPVLELKPG